MLNVKNVKDCVTHTCVNVQSVLVFGPVVKSLEITAKMEAGKVVATSDIEICS